MNPTPQELARAHSWTTAHFETIAEEPPFSFTYGGQPSAELLPTWQRTQSTRPLDDRRSEHTVTFTDPETGLVASCVAIEYHDYPIIEWTPYFENTGSADTPIVEDIQAADIVLERPAAGQVVLHHHTGSPCTVGDYQPFRTFLYNPAMPWLGAARKRITTSGGRPSNSDWPYFNVEMGGEGAIVVIGWPGQWAAEFAPDEATNLRVRAGQELTHFTLHPGERVRGPLIVLQFWQSDRIRAHNVWRRWMLEYNLPRPGGRPLAPQLAICNGNHFPNLLTNATDEIHMTERYLQEGIQAEYWWQDAGWYPNNGSWVNVGTWEVDTQRFPGGIRAVSDRLRAQGVKTIVWFEPERVTPGTWLYESHPEWLLGPEGETKLLNLGHPEARQWITDHIDRLLTEEGIDLYRQDFNIDPLPFWQANDAPDRQGITEIRYVTGYLAFWDELLRRHPGMLIDSCASGGRRNDLETLRRAVPLLRSDLTFVPNSDQCQTHGLAFWLPFYGTGMINPIAEEMAYTFHSAACPHFTAGWDVRRPDLDWSLLRKLIGQWRQFAHCYLGDYYPLTSYSLEPDVWMAWQFDRPDLGEGLLQVFRREASPYETAHFTLRGLDPAARYTLTDLDSDQIQEFSGLELAEQGLPVTIPKRPAAIAIMYKKGSKFTPHPTLSPRW